MNKSKLRLSNQSTINPYHSEEKYHSTHTTKNKIYTELADRFGKATRQSIIQKYRKGQKRHNEDFKSDNKIKLPPPKFKLHDRDEYFEEKKQIVERFKYELKKKISKNYYQKQTQQKMHANRVRTMKAQLEQSKKNKTQDYVNRKFMEVNLVKVALENSRAEYHRKLQQLKLQRSFTCWQRRLKQMTPSESK